MFMKNSSNTDMKHAFEYLAKIKTAEPGIDLYAKTLNRIQGQNTIPLFWVRAIACVLLISISAELYFTLINKQTDSSDISNVIYKTNNILYNE